MSSQDRSSSDVAFANRKLSLELNFLSSTYLSFLAVEQDWYVMLEYFSSIILLNLFKSICIYSFTSEVCLDYHYC